MPATIELLNLLTTLQEVGLTKVGRALIRSVIEVARRPVLLAIVTLAFVASAVLCLCLSAIVFSGWWQGFLLELGVGLLIAGIVDVAILGALRGLIEGGVSKESPKIDVQQLLDSTKRIEQLLAERG
jgi:hypothetical protein